MALNNQRDKRSKEIALALRIFATGSMQAFAQPTNVDMSNRLICFNIQSLGEQLKPVAMLSMLEYINTAVMSNERNDPKAATWVYFDEIYLLLRDSLSANFLYTSWKRFRKYNAYATGITQNVQDCLTNDTAYAMLANSEFVVMLRQTKDIDSVVELYGLSEPQRKYLLLAQPGEGIIKMGNSLIPFNNPQPKDTKTYKLLTTKPGEISDVAARTGNTAKSTARMSYRKFRAMQEKRKNLTLQGSTQSASKPTEKEKVTVPTQTERREMFKKQRFRQKAIAAKTPAPQAPVPSSATPAPPPCRVQMQQRLKRQHLTREAVRRYLQKQTAATAAGNTAPIVTHAPKLPTSSNKQATVEAISRGVHYIAAKIKALLSQTVRRAAGSLLALLGAGGVVLLLAMVIGAAAAVIGSPMGILFADESGEPNSIPIAEIVAETNADFGTAINDIVSAHPESFHERMR